MAISINTNISASVAQAAMTRNSRELDSAMEKLSTGKKINSAGDNASGLAITTRMTSQIRGLAQGIQNANDAIAMIATADSGLVEIEDMLQRMRELALQSGTGTTSSQDREYLNTEFAHLRGEIDRIANHTQWNGATVLNGNANPDPWNQTGVLFNFDHNKPHWYPQNTNIDGWGGSTTFGNFAVNNSLNIAGAGSDNGMSKLASKVISANTVGSAITLASSAIGQLDVVLENVQKQRTYFGAVSNKISHLINQKTVERLNMQASRSRILDTDYAATTSELAKRQILQQAGVAMIAQANALPQTVMMLLSD